MAKGTQRQKQMPQDRGKIFIRQNNICHSSLPNVLHSHTCSEKSSRTQLKQARAEHIVISENVLPQSRFVHFTFYLKYKAQTLAIVPLEMVPQGRNISLDKHLEEEAWHDTSAQKFQGIQCAQPTSSLLAVQLFKYGASCFPGGLATQISSQTRPIFVFFFFWSSQLRQTHPPPKF